MTLCIIKAFPDEFHIASFKTLIELIKTLPGDSDMKSILEMLISRFTFYSANSGNDISQVECNIFNELFILMSHILDKYNSDEENLLPLKN